MYYITRTVGQLFTIMSTIKLPSIKSPVSYKPNAQQPIHNSCRYKSQVDTIQLNSDWTWNNILNHAVSSLNQKKNDISEPVTIIDPGHTFLTQLQSELDSRIISINNNNQQNHSCSNNNDLPHVTSIIPLLPWERDEAIQLLQLFQHMLNKINSYIVPNISTATNNNNDTTNTIDSTLHFVSEQCTIYNTFFDHVIKQVGIHCKEHGILLELLKSCYNKLLVQAPYIVGTIRSQLNHYKVYNIELQQSILTLRKQIKSLNDNSYELNETTRMCKQQTNELHVKYEHLQLKYRQQAELHHATNNEMNSAHAVTHNKLLYEQQQSIDYIQQIESLKQQLLGQQSMNHTLQQQLQQSFNETMKLAQQMKSPVNNIRPTSKLHTLHDIDSDGIEAADRSIRDKQHADIALQNSILLAQTNTNYIQQHNPVFDENIPGGTSSTTTPTVPSTVDANKSIDMNRDSVSSNISSASNTNSKKSLYKTPDLTSNKKFHKKSSGTTQPRKSSVTKVGFSSHLRLDTNTSSQHKSNHKPPRSPRNPTVHSDPSIKQRLHSIMPQLSESTLASCLSQFTADEIVTVLQFYDAIDHSTDNRQHNNNTVDDTSDVLSQSPITLHDMLLNVEPQYNRPPSSQSNHIFAKPNNIAGKPSSAHQHSTIHNNSIQSVKFQSDDDTSRRSSTEIVSVKRTRVNKSTVSNDEPRRSSGRFAIAEQVAAQQAAKKKSTDSKLPGAGVISRQISDSSAIQLPALDIIDVIEPKNNTKNNNQSKHTKRGSILSTRRETKSLAGLTSLRSHRSMESIPVVLSSTTDVTSQRSQSVMVSSSAIHAYNSIETDTDDNNGVYGAIQLASNDEQIAAYDQRINELELLVQQLIQHNNELQSVHTNVASVSDVPSLLPSAEQIQQLIQQRTVTPSQSDPITESLHSTNSIDSNLDQPLNRSSVSTNQSLNTTPTNPNSSMVIHSDHEEKQQSPTQVTELLTTPQNSLQLFIQRAQQHLNQTAVTVPTNTTVVPQPSPDESIISNRLQSVIDQHIDQLQAAVDTAKTSYSNKTFSQVVHELTPGDTTRGNKITFSLNKLCEYIDELYDSKYDSDLLCIQQQYTVLSLPHYIIQQYKQQYGINQYVINKISSMLYSVEHYQSRNNLIELFHEFLNEQRSLYQLTLYLQLRRVVNAVTQQYPNTTPCTVHTPCINTTQITYVLQNIFHDQVDIQHHVLNHVHQSINGTDCITQHLFYSILIHQFIILQHKQQLYNLSTDLFNVCATQQSTQQQKLITFQSFTLIYKLLHPHRQLANDSTNLLDDRDIALQYTTLSRHTGCDGVSLQYLKPYIYQQLCHATLTQ